MAERSIYKDIAKRTGGDIYVGVVGPVRTGKSTFIKKFLDCAVIPNIEDEGERARAIDEIPQSAGGLTVMTTEPKFLPAEAVKVNLPDGVCVNMRLVDCVGYMVDGALGAEEGGEFRMIETPWSKEPMPFPSAAELGTYKVIGEHSTVGMLVTSDGTITDIPREAYVPAEERIAKELSALGKPFAVILNSRHPESDEAHALALELEKKYSAPVALVNCLDLSFRDVSEILSLVLDQFPIKQIEIELPEWIYALPENHPLMREAIDKIGTLTDRIERIGDVETVLSEDNGFYLSALDGGEGIAKVKMPIENEKFLNVIGEICEKDIKSEAELIRVVTELSEFRSKYARFGEAINDVLEKGYGIVLPSIEEMRLSEPELTKQAGGYGVKVSASADSIHMIRTGIKTELCPVVGTEDQSREVVKYLNNEIEDDPCAVWECNMLGKSLFELVRDGMAAKLSHIPDDAREKLGETLGKIVNDGASGLICILL